MDPKGSVYIGSVYLEIHCKNPYNFSGLKIHTKIQDLKINKESKKQAIRNIGPNGPYAFTDLQHFSSPNLSLSPQIRLCSHNMCPTVNNERLGLMSRIWSFSKMYWPLCHYGIFNTRHHKNVFQPMLFTGHSEQCQTHATPFWVRSVFWQCLCSRVHTKNMFLYTWGSQPMWQHPWQTERNTGKWGNTT